jgi:hypothetical protein
VLADCCQQLFTAQALSFHGPIAQEQHTIAVVWRSAAQVVRRKDVHLFFSLSEKKMTKECFSTCADQLIHTVVQTEKVFDAVVLLSVAAFVAVSRKNAARDAAQKRKPWSRYCSSPGVFKGEIEGINCLLC